MSPEALRVSAKTGENIFALKEKNCPSGKCRGSQAPAGGGLIAPGQLAVLVIPIDKAAPKGRLILPQQQVLRIFWMLTVRAICVKRRPAHRYPSKLKEARKW